MRVFPSGTIKYVAEVWHAGKLHRRTLGNAPLTKTSASTQDRKNLIPHVNADKLATTSLSDVRSFVAQALKERPNHASPEHSIATFTLKHLGIKTRGLPRRSVEKRIEQAVQSMEKCRDIKRYKVSKNMRLNLVT